MKMAPVVLFVYKRPWHTRKTIEALKGNLLAERSDLIIFSDGPKDKTEKGLVDDVRRYLRTINGFKTVRTIERDDNYGLSRSIIAGVTEVIAEYGRVVVMEDDLVTSPYFLKFMNEGLEYYETNNHVISIHGYVFPVKGTLPETFFIRGADCWGWATWKRGWDLFEPDGLKLISQLEERKLTHRFDMNGAFPYTQMLRDQANNKVDSWAIRWHASAFLLNKVTLFPGQSLVQNIGVDSSGTHCDSVDFFLCTLSERSIAVGGIEVRENDKAFHLVKGFFWRRRIRSVLRTIVNPFRRGTSVEST